MKVLITSNRVHEAINLLNEMEKKGISVDATTFNTLLTACANHSLF